MDFIHQQLLERNSRETVPFVSIYESYTSLLNLTDTLQTKCSIAESDVERLQQQIHDSGNTDGSTSNTFSTASNSLAIKSAMRNETRLREQLEGIQEEYNGKVKELFKKDSLLKQAQSLNATQEKSIEALTQQLDHEKKSHTYLKQKLDEIEVNSKLLEEQNDKLKVTIRSLQYENDKLKKENLMFEGRLVAEKGKIVDEMNELTDMVERLKAEVDLLRVQGMEKKAIELNYSSWFGSTSNGGLTKKVTDNASADSVKPVKNQADGMPSLLVNTTDTDIVPTAVIHSIKAHAMEGTCVRYDRSGASNFIATASSDSTVRVWDSVSGQQQSMFRGTPGYAIVCCDIAGTLVVGGGSDKSCRVWDVRNERMVC
jgi:WD40 repeat protein